MRDGGSGGGAGGGCVTELREAVSHQLPAGGLGEEAAAVPLRAVCLQGGRGKRAPAGPRPHHMRVAQQVLCPSILGLHVAEPKPVCAGAPCCGFREPPPCSPGRVCPAAWCGLVDAAAAGVKLAWDVCRCREGPPAPWLKGCLLGIAISPSLG